MTIVRDNGIIKGATVPAIIEYFIHENTDYENLDHFFAAFPQFMDANQFWKMWQQSCEKIPKTELKQEISASVFTTSAVSKDISTSGNTGSLPLITEIPKRGVKESTLNFLWAWLERAFYRDFLQTKKKRNGIFVDLLKFLETVNRDSAIRFKLLMLKAANERKRRVKQVKLRSGTGTATPQRTSSTNSLNGSPNGSPPGTINSNTPYIREIAKELASPPPSSPAPGRLGESPLTAKKVLEPGKFDFVDLDPLDVAQQLTAIEFDTFKQIQESELYKLAWKGENRLKVSPNVCKLFERFNTVSYWVATEIVMQTMLKDRVNTLKKFIIVAEHLRDMNNFNGVMEIIAGINMWSVTRLKNTWEQLPKPQQDAVEKLNDLMSTQTNYKNYRAAIKNARLPVLPYLGIYLRDLTFIAENPDLYDKEKGLFNFEKLKMIGGVVTELKRFQLADYVLERNDVLQEYLTKLLTLPEEMLFKHSQLCEPNQREST